MSAPALALYPLSRQDLAAGRDPAAQAAILAAAQPFLAAGLLQPVDVLAAELAGRRAGEHRPEVLLALALAHRAPRRGHLCLDLGAGATLPVPDGAEPASLPWPVDRGAWLAEVRGSPLVADPRVDAARRPWVLDGALLYTDRYWRYEALLEAQLRARAGRSRPVVDPSALAEGLRRLFPPSPGGALDHQQLGCAVAAMRRLLVLTGGPGTGKTHTVRNLLTLELVQHRLGPHADRPLRVRLAAPTGKAAARMREAIQAQLPAHAAAAGPLLPGPDGEGQLMRFFSELSATTLHRLLGYQPQNPTRFRHHAGRPLDLDLLIVDEASMVDAALMARLLDAVPAEATLVLLGDRDQLASVEAGAVLADVCAGVDAERPALSAGLLARLQAEAGLQLSGRVGVIPEGVDPGLRDATVALVHSRRFRAGSGIGRFARAAIRGDADACAACLREGLPDLLPLPPRPRLDGVALQRVLDGPPGRGGAGGFARYLELLRAGPGPGEDEATWHRRVWGAFDEVRILCAHREGELGVDGLNRAVLAGLEARAPGHSFQGPAWLGRPVLVTVNDPGTGLANGDVGLVLPRLDPAVPGGRSVAFVGPDGLRYLPPARLPAHETVFAMTVHKSQGSEFWHTALVLPLRPSRVLTRELIYTGATRAREVLSVLGVELAAPGGGAVLQAGVAARSQRATGLAARLHPRSLG